MYEAMIRFKKDRNSDVLSEDYSPGFFQCFVESDKYSKACEKAIQKYESKNQEHKDKEIIEISLIKMGE